MSDPLRITVPAEQVNRPLRGPYLTGNEGEIGGKPVIISLSYLELHIEFSFIDAPAVVIDLMDIVRAATIAHSAALVGTSAEQRRKL